MVFEKATAADKEQLIELRIGYLREDFGELSPDDEARIRGGLPGYFERHLNNDLIAFVAREGESLAGCVLLRLVEKPMSPAFLSGMTGAVLNVFTRSAFRGRGCATRLMTMLMAEAAARRLDVVELNATDMGYGLYKNLGFEERQSRYRAMRWRPDR